MNLDTLTPEQYFARKRKVHLDMNLPEDAPGMFERFDAQRYVRTLTDAHVNTVTIFAHCHHGNCYYDTAIGHKHSRLTFDYEREVASEQIGEILLRRLRELNAVAYVRFAAVFRQYRDVDEFVEEIQTVRDLAAVSIPEQASLFED